MLGFKQNSQSSFLGKEKIHSFYPFDDSVMYYSWEHKFCARMNFFQSVFLFCFFQCFIRLDKLGSHFHYSIIHKNVGNKVATLERKMHAVLCGLLSPVTFFFFYQHPPYAFPPF